MTTLIQNDERLFGLTYNVTTGSSTSKTTRHYRDADGRAVEIMRYSDHGTRKLIVVVRDDADGDYRTPWFMRSFTLTRGFDGIIAAEQGWDHHTGGDDERLWTARQTHPRQTWREAENDAIAIVLQGAKLPVVVSEERRP